MSQSSNDIEGMVITLCVFAVAGWAYVRLRRAFLRGFVGDPTTGTEPDLPPLIRSAA